MALKKTDYVYFIFSREQMDFKKQLASKRGKLITFGNVIINGNSKMYTDIVSDPSKCRYADARVIASGVLGDIKYTKEK